LLALVAPTAEAAKKRSPDAFALVSGTVFRESGYALPNAEVTLIPDAQPDGAPVKIKKMQALSDSRGEFVFRVPPAAMHYIVKVAAKGFQGQQKSVSVQAEERSEVTFQLEPESK
jgi:hypothetical protein